MSGMIQINLNGIILEVDEETAKMLQEDEVFRTNYEQAVRAQLLAGNESTEEKMEFQAVQGSIPDQDNAIQEHLYVAALKENVAPVDQKKTTIWTSKHASPKDYEATTYMLELRNKYSKEFEDQKTSKTSVWLKIAKQMNEKNFFVGEGVEGAEKCRKKFANLQASYVKYKDKKRQTGEGNVAKPPYFDLIDVILGKKDKVTPQIIIDSINFKDIKVPNLSTTDKEILKKDPQHSKSLTSNQEPHCSKSGPSYPLATLQTTNENSPSTSSDCSKNTPSTSSDCPKNKFESIKSSVRPPKNQMVDNLVKLFQKDLEERRTEFNRIMSFLETSSQQRHEQVMALVRSKKNKKRKRKNSESSSDSD